MKEKLQAAKKLIDTQLELKDIEESYSPWNSPHPTPLGHYRVPDWAPRVL